MKFLLIVPTFQYKDAYPTFLSNSDFPVGFAYIAGALRRAGHDVYGLNPNNDASYQSAHEMVEAKIRDAINRFRPELVGLGGLCTDYAFIRDAIGIVRRIDPGIRIVCGGGIVTHDPEFIFPDLKPDFCVIGEGEEVIVELAGEIAQGRNYEGIPNIGYWLDGKPRFTRVDYSVYGAVDDRAFPDYAPFGMDDMLDRWSWATRMPYRFPNPHPRVMTLVTARGCPFSCSFCVHHHGPRYRVRSIPNILEEIDELHARYRFNVLLILDEMFAAHKSRMKEFCQLLIAARSERGWDFHWMFQTHANAALDREMLTLAKTAGCALFGYGIESASPRVLKSMNKRSKLENIVEAIALSESVGVGFGGNFIFGDPAEDSTTVRETLDFFWKYCTRMLVFIGQIHPYPGSLLFEQSVERGLIRDKKDFYTYIDERVWNMTRLPDRIWYPWISLLFYFASKLPWVHGCEAVFVERDAESGKGDAQLPGGMAFYNVTAPCPHCGRKALFREALPGDARGAMTRQSWFMKFVRIICAPSERLNRFRLKAAAASVLYLMTSFRHPIFGLLPPFMNRPTAGVSFVTVCLDCGRLMRVAVPQLCKTPARPGLADRVALPLLKRLFALAMTSKQLFIIIFTVCLAFCFAGCESSKKRDTIPYRQLLSHLVEPDYVARLDVPGTAIITSFDPSGGNDDFNHPLRVTSDGWAVLADLKGPGYVSRFWFTGSEPKHRIRFFFDNERNPRLDMTMQEFCGGVFPFRPPLAVYENYCWYNYVPIPYAKRLVIMTQKGGTQSDGGPKLFHQINFISLPQTSRIDSFAFKLSLIQSNSNEIVIPATRLRRSATPRREAGIQEKKNWIPIFMGMTERIENCLRLQKSNGISISAEDIKCINDISKRWENIGQFKCADGELAAKNIEVTAGGKQSVVLPAGPAMVRELVVRPVLDNLPCPLQRKVFLRDVILKIYWDGQTEASVAVPFGSFFGSVWQKTAFGSMYFGMTNDSFYCRFPMPYRAQAVIELENQMTNAVDFNITVKGEKGEKNTAFPPQYGFFHAAWNRTTERETGRPHYVLNVNGQGRYAGCILSALSLDKNFWLLEGDEIMTRDGESEPFWRGTGLEDYFNGGWYYQNVLCRPLHGVLFKSFFRTVQYRVHLPDPVLFKNKFNMIFERGPDNNSRGWMESVAFYYLDQPRAAGSVLLSPENRMPPVDEPQVSGFMLDLFNYERFGDYRGEIESIEAFLEQYSDSPFSDVLKLRKSACIERISGMAQSRPLYEKIAAESKDAAAQEQAKMLLWFHERNSNAILGLYANTPARCFLDGQLITETSHPAKLTTAAIELKAGRHVLAIQCRYHPYPAWIQACLRTHSGAVITDPSWKHCVDPSGNWAGVDYNDSAWQIVGGTGSKGPPEEPFVWIEPNAFVDMQSLAAGLFCSMAWPDKTKPLVFRHVFEIQERSKDGK